jgi:hypothetical protein
MRDSLYRRALLYACGELDSQESAAFEELLAHSQDAREALVTAMSTLSPLDQRQKLGPEPAYRSRVRRELTRRSVGYRVTSPWLAACAGAAVALTVAFLLDSLDFHPEEARTNTTVIHAPARKSPMNEAPVTTEGIYSELSNQERIERLRLETRQGRPRLGGWSVPHRVFNGSQDRAASGSM